MDFTQMIANMGYWIGGAALLLMLFLGGYIWFIRANQMQGG